jgi:hypothetical protein
VGRLVRRAPTDDDHHDYDDHHAYDDHHDYDVDHDDYDRSAHEQHDDHHDIEHNDEHDDGRTGGVRLASCPGGLSPGTGGGSVRTGRWAAPSWR